MPIPRNLLRSVTMSCCVASLVLLGGCNDDDDDDSNPAPTPPPAGVSNPPQAIQIIEDENDLLNELATYTSSEGAEIVAFDPDSQRAFVIGGGTKLEVVDLSTLGTPSFVQFIDLATFGNGINSVSVKEVGGGNSVVAVAVERTLEDLDIYESGYGSGMAKVPDGAGAFVADEFYLLTDRGANGALEYVDDTGSDINAKIFPEPDFAPRIGHFQVDSVTGDMTLVATITLKDAVGTELTGLPNPGPTATGETAVDIDNNDLGTDPNGIDSEGLVALQDGTFWVSDEYGPHIAHFDASGNTLKRINPFSSTAFSGKTLPPVYGTRRANRGMEGLTYVPAAEIDPAHPFLAQEDWLVGIMQTAMHNPARKSTIQGDSYDVRNSPLTRILFFPADPASSSDPLEFLYLQDEGNRSNSEIRYVDGSNGMEYIVLERDGSVGSSSSGKDLQLIDISSATDVYDAGSNGLLVDFDLDGDTTIEADEMDLTLEQMSSGLGSTRLTAGEIETRLAALSAPITPASKTLFLDIIDGTDYEHDKPEGFVIIGDIADRRVVIANDDDFGFDTYEDSELGDTGQMFPKELMIGGSLTVDHPFLYQMTSDMVGDATVEDVWEYPEASWTTLVDADEDRQRPGYVVFLDAVSLLPINAIPTGFLPDMVDFSADGSVLLVANEGEPNDDYSFDPEGSVTIVDTSGPIANLDLSHVSEAGFTDFNAGGTKSLTGDVRIFGPGASVAQDLEPEYIAIDATGTTAWVSCQENNALAVVDIASGEITEVRSLGTKDGMTAGNEFDASNKDDAISIRAWPVQMMYQPDMIATYNVGGIDYVVSANEGDARDYGGYSEEARVKDLTLDHVSFLGWTDLQEDEELGRLKTTTANGDDGNDGDHEVIYAYGGRSFSIWNGSTGARVYDSANHLEMLTASRLGGAFNADDSRSDDKGPEPEAITIGTINSRTYAFVGLERTNGVAVYDITDPSAVSFVQYVRNSIDVGPEGLAFIPAAASPSGTDALLVANEESNTLTIYSIPSPPPDLAPQATN